MGEATSALRHLPSVEKLVRSPRLKDWETRLVHPARVRLAQALVSEWRDRLKAGKPVPEAGAFEEELEARYRRVLEGGIRAVVNGTGVVLHTNLGRAPLGRAWLEEMAEVIWGYCTLEYDELSGSRGSRTSHLEECLRLLTGAEGALAVNNNAAATFLVLQGLAQGKEVVISRGELVQIGGGYRVPDILAASGAKLVEVGTTNMTSARDYEAAIGPGTGLVLKVHQSNFFIAGHTESVEIDELSRLARSRGVRLAVDLGSGLMKDQAWDPREPTVEGVLRAGADLVCFSGDKLLGGPQAGIVLGREELVARLRKSPLYRALRLGKTEIFLLEKALLSYLQGRPTPAWERLEEPVDSLKARAVAMAARLEKRRVPARVVDGFSSVGGGTMPASQLPSLLLALDPPDPEDFVRRLREGAPIVVVRLEKKRVLIDLRTIFPEEEPVLEKRITESWG